MDLRIAPRATVRLRLNLDAGSIVPAGAFVSAPSTGERFRLLGNVANLGNVTGNIYGQAECITDLPVTVGAGGITKRDVTFPGWNSVTNPSAPVQPGDLDISSGDLQLTTGIEAIAQDARIRLKFFRGEWFLNTAVGIPYFANIMVKNSNLDVIRFIFKKAIEDIPQVAFVSELDLNIDRPSRTLSVNISGKTDLGAPISFTENLIFESI